LGLVINSRIPPVIKYPTTNLKDLKTEKIAWQGLKYAKIKQQITEGQAKG